MESTAQSLQEAILHFSDFENCQRFMVALRWPNGVISSPRCGAEKVTWLEKPRVWKCYAKHERPTFTLKTGTIFEESPIPMEKWLPAAWLVINCKNGISSYELSRDLKLPRSPRGSCSTASGWQCRTATSPRCLDRSKPMRLSSAA